MECGESIRLKTLAAFHLHSLLLRYLYVNYRWNLTIFWVDIEAVRNQAHMNGDVNGRFWGAPGRPDNR